MLASCHVCGVPTEARIRIGDGVAPLCSPPCWETFAHELRMVAAVDAWLAAVPDGVSPDEVIARFRRGEWRSVLLPAPPATPATDLVDDAKLEGDAKRAFDWFESGTEARRAMIRISPGVVYSLANLIRDVRRETIEASVTDPRDAVVDAARELRDRWFAEGSIVHVNEATHGLWAALDALPKVLPS